MGRVMSDTEIRHRKKVQAGISQAGGVLGLTALGGTLAASRGGRGALRKIPALKDKIAKPPPLDPNRDKIKGAITPVLATGAGLGGIGSFNFASYTRAESKKRQRALAPQKPKVSKGVPSMGIEMGYVGEEGHPVELPEITVPIEKAWSPVASNYDPEAKRRNRSKKYESGALVGAGAAGAYAGAQGVKAGKAAKKIKVREMAPVTQKKVNAAGDIRPVPHWKAPGHLLTEKVPTGHGAALKAGGKAAAGAAAAGGALYAHKKIREKRKAGWQSYEKRDAVSAFGVDHR